MADLCKEAINDWQQKYGTVRIKLLPPRKNQIKGFYILINTDEFSSYKKNEYVIKRRILKLLDKAKIKYKEIK